MRWLVGVGGGRRRRGGGVESVLVVFLLVSRIIHDIINFISVALVFTVLKLLSLTPSSELLYYPQDLLLVLLEHCK